MSAGISDSNADAAFQALTKEVLKVKNFYTGGKLSTRFEALENTINGGPALRTDYTYSGDDVDAMKETLSAWDSTWDIPNNALP